MKAIVNILDTLPSYRLSDTDLPNKKKYYTRFVNDSELFEYNTEEQFIKDVIDLYRIYWTSILMKQKSIESADTALKISLADYLVKNYTEENN